MDEENFMSRRKQKGWLYFIPFPFKADSNAFRGKWNAEINSWRRDGLMVHVEKINETRKTWSLILHLLCLDVTCFFVYKLDSTYTLKFNCFISISHSEQ